LYVRYEDLINNKRREIERIIQFCQLDTDEAAIQRAMALSSFEYMKANEEKFGVQPRVKEIVYDQFIRKGVKGEGEKTLSDQQKQMFYKHYNHSVKPLEQKIFQQ
jgi:hypothetical protein